MQSTLNPKIALLAIAVSSCMALTACGGGSDNSHHVSNSNGNTGTPSTPIQPPNQNTPTPSNPSQPPKQNTSVSSVTTDPTSPMVGQTYQVTVHGTDLTNLKIDGCQSAQVIKASPTPNPTQVTYQCTAPSTA